MIPAAETPELQIKFANRLRESINTNPFLVLLAYYKATEFFQTKESANATYMIGRIFHELKMPHAAITALKSGQTDLENFEPFASLSQIALASIAAEIKMSSATHSDMRFKIVKSGLQQLEKISENASGQTKIRSEIEKARLLANLDSGADSLLQAITILNKLIREFPDNPSEVSESLVLKAEIYGKLGRSDGAYSIYKSIIQNFPDQTKWTDVAIEKSLSYILKGMQHKSLEERIRALREISESNHIKYPMLAAGALNRAGDLYFSDDNWARAKEVYGLVLEKYPFLPVQSAAVPKFYIGKNSSEWPLTFMKSR
ncbi:MAG: tetratricopeptide repeat protein [Deltaproteobacteria bacterium]|nr:tetratricopeptide repeat protein [Deltaproteobacteria bacterium]